MNSNSSFTLADLKNQVLARMKITCVATSESGYQVIKYGWGDHRFDLPAGIYSVNYVLIQRAGIGKMIDKS